ncbi:hypothetical protein [Alicyclobacillus sp. SO9]|uniref:hypothetical protein n=1 Tax=Alicyclobacillus sp. SO9 TaxID=2665646 RepID=UPI0018E72ECA|nr:hypothetical protein [Alicyclobacillus sp. SO9]QQE78889.1 hypothetical protein GI364_24165 [Alicyclobacillus sp. SO9]
MKRKTMLAAVSLIQVGLISGCGTHGQGNTGTSPQKSSSNQTTSNSTKTNSGNSTKSGSASSAAQPWPTVSIRPLGNLPNGVEGNTLALSGSGPVSIGGYTGRVSVTNIDRLQPSVASIGHLAVRTHDAAAAYLGSDLYVFGGGQAVSYNTIVKLSKNSATAKTVGKLSSPLSDAAAVPFKWKGKQGIVRVGGYDGNTYRQSTEFFSITNGVLQGTKMFAMPVGLRYAAVAAGNGKIYIAGGKTHHQGFSAHVYSWSPQKGIQKLPVQLAYGIAKAALFVDGSYLLVAGGENQKGVPIRNILAINIRTGKTKVVGKLPGPLADFGYTQQGKRGFIAGGKTNASGSQISSKVYEITW